MRSLLPLLACTALLAACDTVVPAETAMPLPGGGIVVTPPPQGGPATNTAVRDTAFYDPATNQIVAQNYRFDDPGFVVVWASFVASSGNQARPEWIISPGSQTGYPAVFGTHFQASAGVVSEIRVTLSQRPAAGAMVYAIMHKDTDQVGVFQHVGITITGTEGRRPDGTVYRTFVPDPPVIRRFTGVRTVDSAGNVSYRDMDYPYVRGVAVR